MDLPGKKRALDEQVREQLSFLPFLLQVSVARGDTVPAKHITSSKEQASINKNYVGKWETHRSAVEVSH